MNKVLKRILWTLGTVVMILLLLVIILGSLPTRADPVLSREEITVGSQIKADAATGLDVPFPATIENPDNPSTPAKVELGRLLFFDPLLSGENDLSCATCHHPDAGFSNASGVSFGKGDGHSLRNVPTLWEVAYKDALFLDGRAESLETQLLVPLTSADEMAQDPDALLEELQAIDAYQNAFKSAFPESADPISIQSVSYALAAFERSLVAHDTPFDRYAAGDRNALTASQRRGFHLFRSGSLGCYNCHNAPTFSSGTYEVIGVPDADGTLSDLGRGAISGNANENYAFRVPSLRNVALTAPYMHNGAFETLEEVLAFYSAGGGKGNGVDVPNQSRHVRSFSLTTQETTDLVNFLMALSDESNVPKIPQDVPSGLPVVGSMENPARERVAASNVGGNTAIGAGTSPQVLTVKAGDSIQAVVDQARPGDTIEIEFSTYHEGVIVDINDLTIRGIPNSAGEYPTIDGQEKLTDGISATGNNFTVEKLRFLNFTNNGVKVDGAVNIVMRDLYVENPGIYGTYPVHCTGALVERVEVVGAKDAGVYAGQCENVVVRDSVVYGNVIGIEVENSINAEIYNNHAYDNTIGIFIPLLPHLPSKASSNTKIYNNLLETNNHENFAPKDITAAIMPRGGGIGLLGSDNVEIYGNTFRGNDSVAVGIFRVTAFFDPAQVDVAPHPEQIYIHNNTYENNGGNADQAIRNFGLQGADIIWDASTWDVRVDDKVNTSFPPILPNSGWPAITRKAFWQVFHYVVENFG
ncbi:MAG TPA: parallel beta-helix domain-containing protein [Anaerolineales bacterium]|nr:parallel beta-helix domain-containing protein [Anaerolineales bacterium]